MKRVLLALLGTAALVFACDGGSGPRAVRWDVNVAFQRPLNPFP